MSKCSKKTKGGNRRQSKRTLSLLFALGGAIFILAIILGFRLWHSGVYMDVVAAPISQAQEPLIRHPLTGESVEAAVRAPWVYALMIDNSIDAWPQSGLDQAFFVIETLAEGRIPRFLAFYRGDQTVEKIGPVRSARSYFIDWASGFGALFGHVGGSPQALIDLQTANVFDLNQYYHSLSFWRSTDRFAPHNVYASTDLLQEALTAFVETDEFPSYDFWSFKEDVSLEERPENGVIPTADFGSEEYFVEWSYDRETNTYTRFQGGEKILLEDGAWIVVNNVIVMKTSMEVLDAIGRRDVRVLGEGEAVVYQDGVSIEATWKKESETSMLQFFDFSGVEIGMNAGSTWIEVVEK